MRFLVTQIDQIIMFCAGAWMTAAGFGYVTLNRSSAWVTKVIPHFRWMGPLLILISLILAIAKAGMS